MGAYVARRGSRLISAARLTTALLSGALVAAVLLVLPWRALASDTFFEQKCAACHPSSATGPTCAGCHSHGVHGTTARNEINFQGTTSKTSYAAGETVTVTLNGGNQGGWLRTTLVDQNGLELGRTTGPNTMGGGPALPVTLSGPAPSATGMYTWQVRWFGNQYDAGAATFGKPGEWISDWEPNHGYQIGYTNTFFVGSVPKLALAPAALDFGAIAVGANESLTTTLQSVGNASITVSAVGRCSGTSAAYTTSPAAPFTIPAGGSQILTVRYGPTAAATDTGCIAITSNDLYSAVTNLPVTGVASSTPQPTIALSPNPIDFGGVAVNSTAQRTLSVVNTGTGPLTVSAIAVGAGAASVFSWSPAPPFTVAAGATQAVTVTYAPLWEWIDDTTLTVTSNAVNAPSASVAVKATGYIAPQQSCTSCHGDANRTPAVISAAPPVDTKGNTLSVYPGVGAHMTHLTSTRITGVPGSCTDCHASPTGTHPSGVTEFSWAPIARTGGASPTYDFVTNTCSNVYCHGATLLGGTNKTPKWTQLDGTQAACGNCHGIPPPNGTHSGMTASTACGNCHTGFTSTTVNAGLHVNGVVDASNMTCTSCHGTAGRAGGTGDSGANPVASAPPVDTSASALTTSRGVGAHVAHLTGTRLSATPVACAECHLVPTSQTHANGTRDLAWGSLTRTGGLSPAFNTTTFTCSNTWCHGGTTALRGGTITAPTWTKVDGTQAACGTCHGNPPPAPHVQNTACGSCHSGYTQTTVNATQHLNGVIDYTTQSCTTCHGTATRTGGTGATGANPVASSPPADTLGGSATTARGVGAHVAHLTGTRFSATPVACAECHTVPTTNTHANGTRDLAWGTLTRTGGLSPAFNTTTFTCNNTWCHGGTPSLLGGTVTAPQWTRVDGTQAACGTCHGVPPASTSHNGLTASSPCGNCHTGYTGTSVNAAQHIDGVVQYVAQTCTSCHGTAGRVANAGISGIVDPNLASSPPVDVAGTTNGVRVGDHLGHANPTTASQIFRPLTCTDCHPDHSGNTAHSNAVQDVTMATIGGIPPGVVKSAGTTPATCTTYCHGAKWPTGDAHKGARASWAWNGAAAGCGDCHASPPVNASHGGVTAVTNCGNCHAGYTATTVNVALHINGVGDVNTQTCTSCHGTLGRTGGTGASGANPVASAPPLDTLGGSATTARGVGAHLAHLTGTRFSATPVACAECHVVPTATGHSNGTRDVAWGTLTRTGGLTPGYSTTTLACSNTWCHGGTPSLLGGTVTAPVWTRVDGTQAACGTCHAVPPASASHSGLTASSPCANCHTGYTGTTVNATLHLNGVIDYTAQTCTTCHGTAGRTANAGLTGTVDANLASSPPVDTAGTTTGVRVGDHLSHVNPTAGAQIYRPLTCTDCHPNHAGNNAHANATQDVTMATIGGIAPTVVKSSGTTPATCTTYCHGAKWPTGDAHKGARTSWTWNGANAACGDCHAYPPTSSGHGGVTSTTNCGNCHTGYTATTVNVALHINGVADVNAQTCTSCHGSTSHSAGTGATGTNPVAAAPPVDTLQNSVTTARGVGAHIAHLTGTRFSSAAVGCSECHTVPTSTSHSNGTRDLAFGTLTRTGGLSPAFNTTTFTCANTWCHGNSPSLFGGTVTQPQWTKVDGTQAACGTCHGVPPPSPHVQNTTCGNCHTGYTQTAVNATLHLNGTIDVNTRTCTMCHGSTSHSAGTGATGTNPVAAAPPTDTRAGSATTARGVGAHIAHLTGTTLTAASMVCNDCHVVPTSTTHANGTTANPYAQVIFSSRSTSAGSTAAAWNTTSFTCSNSICHGSTTLGGTNKTPNWTVVNGTQAACGTCHGIPPPAPHAQNSTCGNCHTGYTSTAVNKSLHINFAVNSTTNCTSCHGTQNRVANSGIGTTDANLASAPPVDASGSSTSVKVGDHLSHLNPAAGAQLYRPLLCADCHPNNTSTGHSNGTLDVTLATIATYPGSVVKSSGTTPASCTTYCHGSKWPTGDSHKGARTSWTWTGANAACGDCHADPPTSSAHSGVTSTTNCGGCHTGYTATTVNLSLHINGVGDAPIGGEPVAGGTSCGACHKTIFDGMTGGVTKVSKHTLGGGDAPTPGTASWTTAANLKASPNYAGANCVSMCHGDHPHTVSGVTTHPYNAYLDANSRSTAASTTTRSSKDFDSTQSSGGLCTSCHRLAVAAGRQAVGTSFAGTAHQYTSKTVGTVTYTWQYTLHDNGAFGRDCTKCHASQAEGRAPTSAANSSGNVGPHSSDFGALLAGTRNAGTTPANLVCYNCHGNGTTGLNTSGKDLATAVSRGATTSGGSHKTINSETVHATATEAAATWNNGAFSGTKRHTNCLDCHSTHLARTGLVSRTATATSTRNQLPPSMSGATGVAYTTYPTRPTTACASGATLPNACVTQTTAASFGTNLVTATYEYQVCFKCHSSFAFGNTSYPTGVSGLQTTDTAAEFSPTNRSGHPVVTGLSSYTGNTAPKALAASQLLAPWNTNVGTQTMLCSDCHNTDAASPAAQGPHGSAITFMLTGANKAWPYTVAGATSGTLFRVSTSETGINTNNGLFCRNCHPQQNSTGSNSVHRNSNIIGGQHGSSNNVAACTACHIRVPHGGKLSRLFVTTNAPARYKIGTPAFSQVTKNASGKDGYGTGWPAGMRSSCSQHSSQTGSETW
jgi:predicted CxxxxCH...CXXCH cytochrome family protein